jgi:hypothetical protein
MTATRTLKYDQTLTVRWYRTTINWIAAHPLLVALLLIAFVLRISTIFWGIPMGFSDRFHPDENKYLRPAIYFTDYIFTTKPFPLYGTSLQYTLGPLLVPFRWALGAVGAEGAYFALASVWLRFAGVVFGTLGIYLTYRLAEKYFDSSTAMVSAALLTVSPYHVLNSAIFTVDVPMSTLLIVNLLLVTRLTERQSLSAWTWLGVASGYMVGMKLSALLFLTVPISMILIGSIQWRDSHFKRGIQRFVFTAVSVFTVLNLQFFAGFSKFVARVVRDKIDFWDRVEPATFHEVIAGALEGYISGLSLPIFILAILGMATAVAANRRVSLPLIVMIAAFGLYFRHYVLGRYVIFIAPIAAIFAATLLVRLWRSGQAPLRWATPALLAVSLGLSLTITIGGIASRLWDERIQAARFLAYNFPDNTTIGLAIVSEEYANTHRWRFPVIKNPKHQVVGVWKRPDLVVTSALGFRRIEEALKSRHISENYVWDEAYDFWWHRNSSPSPRLFAFYDRLLNSDDYKLIQSFKRPLIEFPAAEFSSREVRIYARSDGLTPP